MLRFNSFNPIAQLFYFTAVLLVSMFTWNYIILLLSLLGAAAYCVLQKGFKVFLKSFFGYALIFLLVTVTNPLFSHKGATPLVFINDIPITIESIVYGAVLGLMLLSVILWFSVFNSMFDSEKLIYIFGRILPRLALLFSMVLHFVPKFISVFKRTLSAQSDFYGKNKFRQYIGAFSSSVSVMLEGSVQTADSMRARGYGVKKRSFYCRFPFTKADALFVVLTLALLTGVLTAQITGQLDFMIYPRIIFCDFSPASMLGITAFGALSFMPFIIELKEELVWKYSLSKI